MNKIIENLSPNVGHLKLTKTMLEKHIIDANASIQKLALLLGVDMSELVAGDKVELVGEYTDGTPCKIRLYRAATRGDKRVSISGLKHRAAAGQDIALSYRRRQSGDYVLVINISEELHDALPEQSEALAREWGIA